jgi:hypothetical protein
MPRPYLVKGEQRELFDFIVKRLTEKERELIEKKHPGIFEEATASCITYIGRVRQILAALKP